MHISFTTLLLGAGGAVVWMTVLYGVRRMTRNAGVVDVGWAFGTGLLAVALAITGTAPLARRLLLAVLAGGWSFRLGWFLLVDRVWGAKEDGRYGAMLAAWGDHAERNLYLFYLAQAGFVVLFGIPFLPVVNNPAPVGRVWDVFALVVWGVAVLGERLADRQLARWRADPAHRGRTCRHGLWRYSRHPNYFFEWLHWWTYVLLGIGGPWFWLTLSGPVVMFLFLFRFTGIPYTEAQALKSRGEDYQRYMRTTSRFFPWFPQDSE